MTGIDEGRLREKCGIVGLYTKNWQRSLPVTLVAAGGLQHRGQQGAGLALKTKEGVETFKENGLLKNIFTEEVVERFDKPARWIIVHCRYGTNGNYRRKNLQPCAAVGIRGEKLMVAHNGEFSGLDEMREKIKGKISKGISDTRLFCEMVTRVKEKNWEEKLKRILDEVVGAYSLIMGVGNKMFVARDRFGIKPLLIGRVGEGWMVASETHAFDKVGGRVIREVGRGEIIRIDEKGIRTIKKGKRETKHFCDFEWAYFSRPDSLLPIDDEGKKWLSIARFRENCGTMLAREKPIRKATFVVGVPDSGIALATGYAQELRLPYRQAIIRDHYDLNGDQRLFMGDDKIKSIGKKVLGKLSLVPDDEIWKDAVVVVGDDSIVRGNVSAKITEAIFARGAREVHWMVGFPPIMHPCYLGVSMRTHGELVAYMCGGDVKKIAKRIGATSVNYISPKDFINCRKEKGKGEVKRNSKMVFLKNQGCGGCVTGCYPVNR